MMDTTPSPQHVTRRYSFEHEALTGPADFVLASEHDAVVQENARLHRELAARSNLQAIGMPKADDAPLGLIQGIEQLRPIVGHLMTQFSAILADRSQLPAGYKLPDRVLEALQYLTAFSSSSPNAILAFQDRVRPWLLACFGDAIAADRSERNHRFLEEAVELVQACGCTEDEAHKVVGYVYGRPTGEPEQEVGGVMVTLAALCLAQGLDMHQAGETELARISKPETMDRIRQKQANKPAMSPLPGAYPERQP